MTKLLENDTSSSLKLVETACFIRVQMQRCHAISPFVRRLDFSLPSFYFYLLLLFVFYPDVLYNLKNENELLASMDIDHPVRNSTKK